MAKHYINFDEKVYSINKEVLAPATDALKAHLETLGGGEEGGGLELGEKAKFKDIITLADFEAYASTGAQQTPDSNEIRTQYVMFGDNENTFPMCMMNVANDYSWAYFMYIPVSMPGEVYVYRVGEGDKQIFLKGMDGDGWYYNPDGGDTVTKSTAPTVTLPTNAYMSASLEATAVFFDLGGSSNEVTETVTADSEFSHVSIENCYRIDCPIADIDPETFDGRIDNHYKVDLTFNDGTAAKSFHLDGEGMTESGLVLMPAEGPLAISNGTDIYAYVVEGNLEEVVGAEGYEFLKDIFPPNTILIPQSAFTNLHVETFSITYTTGSGNEGNLDITLDGVVYKVDSAKLAPATNSLIAHIETLKGGNESGSGLEFGKEYKFKDVITEADCEYYIAGSNGGIEIPDGRAYILCDAVEFVTIPVDTSIVYMITVVSNDGENKTYILNGNVLGVEDGWQLADKTSTNAPTIIVAEHGQMSADLATTSIFFDLGGGSGEVTETITADSDFLVEDIAFGLGSMYRISCPINDLSTDNISLGAQGKPIKIDDDIHFHLVFNNGAPAEDFYTNNIADDSELNIRLLEIFPALATAQYLACAILVPNNIEEIFTSFGKPELFDRFKDVYAPNTILIPRYIFEEQDGVESPLETLTVTYSNGTSTGGDLAITINGVEYLVDSAKLADAKSALAAHLEALEDTSN